MKRRSFFRLIFGGAVATTGVGVLASNEKIAFEYLPGALEVSDVHPACSGWFFPVSSVDKILVSYKDQRFNEIVLTSDEPEWKTLGFNVGVRGK